MGPTRTLPGRAYTDPARLDREIEHVLRPSWHCVGRADELADPGDHLAITILDEPVALVRGDDGELRALSNICRHRGMPVVTGAGTAAGVFSCPYHAWSYGLDGVLRTAPFTDPEAVHDCRLPEWPLHVHDGFVYVAVTEDPVPFPSLPVLDAELMPFNPADMRFAHVETDVWACNWKALVENFMEGSHLSFVHRTTLHPLTPSRLTRKGPSDDGFTSYYSGFPDGVRSSTPGEPELTDEQRQRSFLFQRFPTQVACQNPTFLATFLVLPLTVDETAVRWTVSAFRDTEPTLIDSTIELWREINAEDRAVLEQLQRNLAAPSAQAYAGPLADDDREGTIADFHRYLQRQDTAHHS
ncbi:MAG: aromatic ring-hydroxylating dioxygenase subunit alpha [Actinomycetota bacterium]